VNYEFEIRVKIFRLQEVVAVNYFSNTTVNFTHENSQQLWKLYTQLWFCRELFLSMVNWNTKVHLKGMLFKQSISADNA